jgi:hypothetical protein
MAGGSTSQVCANCGSGLQAGARFCRICGQRVAGNDAPEAPFPTVPAVAVPGPRPAPPGATAQDGIMAAPGPGGRAERETLNLPGGGVAPPPSSLEDTVTSSAVPRWPQRPSGGSPAGGSPSGWPPDAEAAAAYPPAAYPPAGDAPAAETAWYQPADRPAADHPSPGGQTAAYQPDYQSPGYQSPGRQSPDYQSPGYQPTAYQPPAQSAGYQSPAAPADYPPADYPPGRPPSSPDGGSRRGRVILAVLAVIVVAGGIAAGLLIARAHSGHSAAGPATSAPAGGTGSSAPASVPPSSAPASSGSASAEQTGASNLSKLLAQSVSDRGAINDAYNDVAGCGPTLSQDQATFQQAVTSRQALLGQLGSMADASALPASMISSLTQAWTVSIKADQDFAAWAGDESASCTKGGSDANLSAATVPDNQATQDKTDFVASWNPIATQYGLPTYAQDQL